VVQPLYRWQSGGGERGIFFVGSLQLRKTQVRLNTLTQPRPVKLFHPELSRINKKLMNLSLSIKTILTSNEVIQAPVENVILD
jgi:hypothetical protein